MPAHPDWLNIDMADMAAMAAGRYGPDYVVPLMAQLPVVGIVLTPLFAAGGPLLLGSMAHSAVKKEELLCLNGRGATMGVVGALAPLPF